MKTIDKKQINLYFKYFLGEITRRKIDLPKHMMQDIVKAEGLVKRDVLNEWECGLVEEVLLYLLNDVDEMDIFEENLTMYDAMTRFISKSFSQIEDGGCVRLK